MIRPLLAAAAVLAVAAPSAAAHGGGGASDAEIFATKGGRGGREIDHL